MPLYLLARIGDEPVAVAAAGVVSVIRPGAVTPVPRAPAHVAGLCALRSRVLTVVDARAAIGCGRVEDDAPLAVVVELGGQGYAILLDGVDDVIEAAAAQPCPAAVAARWRAVATGLVAHDGLTRLLVDPVALIEGRGIAGRGLTDR